MSLGISSSSNRTWKRIRISRIALAVAATLAAGALVSGVAVKENALAPSTSPAPSRSETVSLDDVVNQPSRMFIYVVGSKAEADRLEMAIASAAIEDTSGNHHQIVLVETSQDEAGLQTIQEALHTDGTGRTKLVDLRR